MTQRTQAEITTLISSNVSDNSDKLNTAEKVREVLNDMNDSYANVADTNVCVLYKSAVQIISSDILTGFTIPISIKSAFGVGYIIEIESVIGSITYNTIAYATNITLEIFADTSTDAQFKCVGILGATTNNYLKFEPVIATTPATARQFISNKGIYVRVKTGNPTAGNSDLNLYFTYRILSL